MAASGAGQQPSFAARSALPTFGNFGSTLLERSNPGLRKSTPDSEALASSDEEVEQSRSRSAAQRRALVNRRSSLLADQGNDTRHQPISGNHSHSPAGSQPNTPGVSHDSWSSVSPGVGTWSTSGAYPFGSSIWGATPRDPPARLQEVRQNDPEHRQSFGSLSQQSNNMPRSMSFSAGQSEYESSNGAMDNTVRPTLNLTRRTSRPSNLGHEFGGLARVNESEDNPSFLNNAAHPTQASRNPARTMSTVSGNRASLFRSGNYRNPSLDTAELAIEDVEEPPQLRQPIRGAPTRRLSDFQAILPTRQPNGPLYSTNNFGQTRAVPHYIAGLDSGQLDTIPQSRRHSFADVPTRRGSIGSNEEDNQSASYDAGSQTLSQDNDVAYFHRNEAIRLATEQEVQQQLQQEHQRAIYGLPSPYGMPGSGANIGAFHGPNSLPLYVVQFKCCRADIYYIQEGTGLSVKEGDLVIVEADRGTDLGSVQHSNVSWEAARKYKEKYNEQHHKWLMMFSEHSQRPGPSPHNPNVDIPGRSSARTVKESDLKPKMIKRLAQAHEIQTLQEKEGQEAKAKRQCQQKVADHGLDMEILDAEYQIDSKKLTFYYYSPVYVNFNSLVTDLFKCYKTRIWMDAVNQDSRQNPMSALGITPIQVGAGMSTPGSLVTPNTPSNSNHYSDARDDYRYISNPPMASQQAMPPLYYGGYGQAPQMPDYRHYGNAYQQPSMDPFSNYAGPQAYGLLNPQGPNVPPPRQYSGGRNLNGSSSANGLASQFGSMSLGGQGR